MGWWQIPGGGTIGDAPADAFARAFRGVAAQGVSLADAIASLDRAVRRRAKEVLGDPAAIHGKRVRSDPPLPSHGKSTDGAVEAISAALDEVVKAYGQLEGRKPTLREVLASAAFVLRGPPREWPGDDADARLDNLVAEDA